MASMPSMTSAAGTAGPMMVPIATPDARMASRISTALRASALMASPLNAAIASRWIEEEKSEDLHGLGL
jgi:hypothetical protein